MAKRIRSVKYLEYLLKDLKQYSDELKEQEEDIFIERIDNEDKIKELEKELLVAKSKLKKKKNA